MRDSACAGHLTSGSECITFIDSDQEVGSTGRAECCVYFGRVIEGYMARYEISGSEQVGCTWRLLDGQEVAGISAKSFTNPAWAAIAMALVESGPQKFDTTIVKDSEGKFTWVVSCQYAWTREVEAYGKSAEAFSDSSACKKSAKRFISLLRDAQVPEVPKHPKAIFATSAAHDGTPLAMEFDGSASQAPGSSVVAWEWEFGDGSKGAGITVRHVFAAAGQYQVTLVVRDQLGVSGAARSGVSVVAPEPPSTDTDLEAPDLDLSGVTRMHDAVQFLWAGKSPVQSGVAQEAIKAHRVAVLRGRVSARSGAGEKLEPLLGVTIRVKGHSELGTTQTRKSGAFDMAVNGGATYTIELEKDGYFPVSRRVNVPWEDYISVPTVVLTARTSAVVSKLDLRSDAPIHVAHGALVEDGQPGSRRARLLFPAALSISSANESDVGVLEAPSVRVVEFTTGASDHAAMPATLPQNSGYTYAVDLSVEGANGVSFDKPVVHYVENFLNFAVGSPVPSGYFNPETDCWVAAQNGRVIQVLGVEDGLASVDLDGKGSASPQKLRAFGMEEAELRQIGQLYSSGQSLWRVEIGHFSAWDFNWPYGPPSDAKGPDAPDPEDGEQQANNDQPDSECGSLISVQSQVLGESVPISGSPFALCYSSDRVPGRKVGFSLAIPLSGAELPKSLKAIELEVHIAGQQIARSFNPAPNLNHPFEWDGRDGYARKLQGRHPVKTRVGYSYEAVYQEPGEHEKSFARYSGTATSSPARQEITLWREWRGALGVWDARGIGLGGWSLDVHHFFDPIGRVLYMGDGRRRSFDAGLGDASIVTFAGSDDAEVKLESVDPSGVAVDSLGNVFIADVSRKVFKITPGGETTTHFSTGPMFNQGGLGRAHIGTDGFLYVADTNYDSILRLSPDGEAAVLAGYDGDNEYFGEGGFSGDGGPASAATFKRPQSVVLAPDGAVYIADTGNHRVRRLGVDGIITTIAGNGEEGTEGDGGLAIEAQVEDPVDVAVGPDGSVYIAEYASGLVRRVAPDGIISTFAGTRERWSGEEEDRLCSGPATSIPFSFCTAVAVGSDNAVYVATSDSGGPSLVWRVDATGLMSVLAGSGKKKPGARLPAKEVDLPDVNGLVMGADGALYITSSGSVLRVEAPFENRALGQGVLPDDTGSLGAIVIPDDTGTLLFEFDARGRHRRTRDAFSGATRYSFLNDNDGRLSAIKDGADVVLLSIERNAAGNGSTLLTGTHRHALEINSGGFLSAIEVDKLGKFDFGYGCDGLLTSLNRPWGLSNRYRYDELGRLTHDEDSEGSMTDLFRVPRERGFEVRVLTKLPPLFREKSCLIETQPDGGHRRVNRCCTKAQSVEINPDGTRTMRAADGTVTVLKMQADPRLSMFVPMLRTASIETPGGLKASGTLTRKMTKRRDGEKFPLGFEDRLVFNEDEKRTYLTKFDPESRSLVCSVGKRSVAISASDGGRTATLSVSGRPDSVCEYDANGNVVALSHGGATGRKWTYSYDGNRRLISSTDPMGHVLRFSSDDATQTMSVKHADGRELQTRFEASGLLSAIRSPGGPEHGFKYNGAGLVSEYTPPVIQNCDSAMRWEYDLIGQLTRVDRGAGKLVEFAYDEAGRMISTTGAGLQTRLELDPVSGRIIRVSSANGLVVEFGFDGMLATRSVTSGPVSAEITQSFDDNFHVITQTIADREIEFSYDEDGTLNGVDRLEIKRDSSGILTRLTAGNVSLAFEYDVFGGITSERVRNGSASLLEIAFSRDGLGRVLERTETRGRTKSMVAFAYDQGARIAKETRDGVAVEYGYDANGNRVSRDAGGQVKASFDVQDRLLGNGDTIFEYESDGTLRSKTDSKTGKLWQFRFDPLGALEKAILPDGTTLGYLNDGFGRRVGETLNGKLTRGFLYHQSAFPIAQLDSRGKVVSRFIYATRRHVPDLMLTNDGTFLIVSDPIGSPRLVIDVDSGEIVQRMDFDAFGRLIEDTKPGFQPFGFAGGLHEPRTGLTRFGAREYDAEIGRWTAKDPILFSGGDTNLYVYCGNDPVNANDPLGLACKCPDFSDLPEVDDPASAILWYYIGQGKPVRMGKKLLAAMKGAWKGGYGGSASGDNRGYVPILGSGGLNSRFTTGGIGYVQRGKLVYVWDKYHFPRNLENFRIHVWTKGEGITLNNFSLLGNTALSVLIGSAYEDQAGLLTIGVETTWSGLDSLGMPTPLSLIRAVPFEMIGCFEVP